MIPKEERIRRIPNSYIPAPIEDAYDLRRTFTPIAHSVTALHESEVNNEYANMRAWFPDTLTELKDRDGNVLIAWYSESYHAWDVYYQELFVDPFCGTNEYRLVVDWSDSATGETGRRDDHADDILNANVVTSKVWGTNEHKPILDVDAAVVGKFFMDLVHHGKDRYDYLYVYPSTTPGHYHVYVDKRMSWYDYIRWMECLVALGILEEGFVKASVARGYSAVRLPWIAKQY